MMPIIKMVEELREIKKYASATVTDLVNGDRSKEVQGKKNC
jgi:hypothetical protein